MAKQFNPFHKWLGFDEDLTHPNHFELFGVKPNSEDPIGFRKRIHSEAKLLLAKLEAMSVEDIGKRKSLHTKMRRFVVRAHDTLLDDKQRAAYLKELRKKARKEKGSAKPLSVHPPSKGRPSQAASATSKNLVMPTMKRSGTPTIKQSSSAVFEEKPTIPMAIPVSKGSSYAVSSVEATASHEANLERFEPKEIAIKPGRIKRKKSWLIPILCGLMALLCIAGLSALVMNFGNKFESLDSAPRDTNNRVSEIAADIEAPNEAHAKDEVRHSDEAMVDATPGK